VVFTSQHEWTDADWLRQRGETELYRAR